MTLIEGYPHVGEEIIVELPQKHQTRHLRGVITDKVKRMRSGFVMAVLNVPSQIEAGKVIPKWVPWTSDHHTVRYYRPEGNAMIDHPKRSY